MGTLPDHQSKEMIFIIVLVLAPSLTVANDQGQCFPGMSDEVLAMKCMENTTVGTKMWEAVLQCGSFSTNQTDMTRGIEEVAALNRNKRVRGLRGFKDLLQVLDKLMAMLNQHLSNQTASRAIEEVDAHSRDGTGGQCYSFDDIRGFIEQNLGDVKCILMNMGWLDTSGNWDIQQSKADIKSLPEYVTRGISWRKVRTCTIRNERKARSIYMGWWNDCRQTYSKRERSIIKMIVRNASRLQCLDDMIMKGCCDFLHRQLIGQENVTNARFGK